MKRIFMLTLCLMICVSVSALASWTCQSCGQEGLEGNFCKSCGAKKPVWTCLACGEKNQDGLFCENCGASHFTANNSIKVGDVISLGHYPQDASGIDNTPVEWIVLDVQGYKALLISKY